jgi:phosphoribosylformylglycinamidine synthase subunit PurSL
MGIIKDVRKACGTDFLEPGDLVYLLGETNGEMGGSIFERVSKLRLGPCPEVKPSVSMPLYRKLANAISGKLARSCHDISEGGLAVALAESCLGGRLGAQISIDTISGSSPSEAARLLFCESPSRFVVSVRPEDRERFESTMRDSPFAMIGMVTERNRLDISYKNETVLELGLKDIEKAFKTPIVQG